MKVSILCVGTELLFGQIVNTNAAWLSEKLQLLGFDVLYHFTVGDNPKRMRDTLKLALEKSDIVITSGGLGPTQDDLTKEIIAETLGSALVFDQEAYDNIVKLFNTFGRSMTDNNVKQAYVPENATILYNSVGTAPGFILSKEGKTVIALPGPPRELTYLYEKYLAEYLESLTGGTLFYKVIRTIGVGESDLETRLLPLIEGQTDPTIATYAKEGECTVRIASKRPTRAEAEEAVAKMLSEFRAIAGEFIYSEDDEDLPTVVSKILVEKNMKITAAESCTAGMFAEHLADYPGISAVLGNSVVTYSNEAKTKILGVPADMIERHGAVSEDVAVAMALGAKQQFATDIAVSVTGIAGPDGGSDAKPVGTAWICVNGPGSQLQTKQIRTRDRGRNHNRYIFMLSMFELLYKVVR